MRLILIAAMTTKRYHCIQHMDDTCLGDFFTLEEYDSRRDGGAGTWIGMVGLPLCIFILSFLPSFIIFLRGFRSTGIVQVIRQISSLL